MAGQKITILYNDTPNTVSKMIGELIEFTTTKLVRVKTPEGKLVAIPLLKVVRIEGL